MRRGAAAVLLAALALPALAGVREPSGYRMDDYRAPVPDTLQGARVVGPEEAHALWASGEAVFVDVLPRAPRPANLPEGAFWRDRPRLSIPGAVWFPNAGYGAIAPVTETWFRDGLRAATGGDSARPLVFFCLDACWMSWNAAKRAQSYGHTQVIWFPEGSDGWTFMDYPVEALTAAPGEPVTQ
ncbi:PQQ-dependent catabolism-associated CXXCW motif protein [Rhodovulum kholense]|uniref:PQQ-dependent catabolism-associated CXXCW motif protein n=1 Tax=Rhodovulum kholense TaxID=453584 RepID=A0A8E2VHE2_9RHOB|nr:PQQ-dependent catabolism-associated CXXCW motif protein [Rhodovulum kholense]PTW42399.1 PQQ-dependent catabolism-associated CXXCW motif protein [Rhodovulum kholense]